MKKGLKYVKIDEVYIVFPIGRHIRVGSLVTEIFKGE